MGHARAFRHLVSAFSMLAVGLLLVSSLYGQQALPSNILKINPLSLTISTFNVKYERKLNERFTGQVGFHIGAPRLWYRADSTINGIQYFYTGITPEFKYYIGFTRNPIPKGVFVSSFCRLSIVNEKYRAYIKDPDYPGRRIQAAIAQNNKVFSFGFAVGYQLLLVQNRLALEGFLGPEYSSSKANTTIRCSNCDGDEVEMGRPGLSLDGVQARGGISLGYCF